MMTPPVPVPRTSLSPNLQSLALKEIVKMIFSGAENGEEIYLQARAYFLKSRSTDVYSVQQKQ